MGAGSGPKVPWPNFLWGHLSPVPCRFVCDVRGVHACSRKSRGASLDTAAHRQFSKSWGWWWGLWWWWWPAFCGLLMEQVYLRVYIISISTYQKHQWFPWGSSMIQDPLLLFLLSPLGFGCPGNGMLMGDKWVASVGCSAADHGSYLARKTNESSCHGNTQDAN